jgi:glycosyltransferase involved in cell wall biosynthesis
MTAVGRNTGETLFENDAWSNARPTISILIPYLRDDPGRLLAALNREGPALNGSVEIILLDDGSDAPMLATEVANAVKSGALPARLIVLTENLGRAAGRNRLAAEARGTWLLFLDSDMLPDGPDFLHAYMSLIEQSAPDVAFGGFSLKHAPVRAEFALHRYMASLSDCTPVAERRRQPEKHVFTSNLLVKRVVFEEERFDSQFSGWGWEDVEWAMRVLARHPILHIENPVTHLGLDPASVLVAKFEQSAANFARVVARHREIVASYPSYRAARLLKLLPLKGVWRPMLRALGLAEGAPLRLRDLALRLYRAALYADVV